jgi:hypothetical protein
MKRMVKLCGVLALAEILCLCGCVSTIRSEIWGCVNPELREDSGFIPTVEVDIAALTDEEKSQLQSAGVDGWFDPSNPLRQTTQAAIYYFSMEQNMTFTLAYNSKLWLKWEQKKPTSLAVIASLPPSPDVKPPNDPRILLIPLKKGIGIKRIFFEVDKLKVIQLPEKPAPVDKSAQKKKTAPKKQEIHMPTEGD